MQVFSLPGHVIRTARAASRLLGAKPHSEAERRRDAVSRWRTAMARGLDAEAAAKAVGVPRSTLYRWRLRPVPASRRPFRLRKPNRPPGLASAVEEARRAYPLWGKRKIAAYLRHRGIAVSGSMAGRILSGLIARGRVLSVREVMRKAPSRPRAFKRPHAIRKPRHIVFGKPGDIVQIDTMTLARALGGTIKHFDAYDPFAKWTVGQPYARAAAKNAARFLDKVIAEMPYPVKAVQIDGGSEFMAEFEQACQDKKLPLYVLPPRSPELNGGVERCNQAWRYEFYGCIDPPQAIAEIEAEAENFQHTCNFIRPHAALDYKTPNQYLSECRNKEKPASHM